MNVQQVKVFVKETKPGGTNYDFDKLFSTPELAMAFIQKGFPDAKEVTAEVTKPWYTNYTTRTFTYEKEQFDTDGEWDYPVQYTIELDTVEVLTELPK